MTIERADAGASEEVLQQLREFLDAHASEQVEVAWRVLE